MFSRVFRCSESAIAKESRTLGALNGSSKGPEIWHNYTIFSKRAL
jgi:hypothetical protein